MQGEAMKKSLVVLVIVAIAIGLFSF